MAIDGISIVTDGLKYGSGTFAGRLTSHGLVGAYASAAPPPRNFRGPKIVMEKQKNIISNQDGCPKIVNGKSGAKIVY